ncbi:hypothetical protein DSM112329_02823 [Paraconexibacter sp. AEG42_29]|uniref:DUF1707 domain-containing protein n=1 Tax=Paraconexibacter sp. AEG42_29 TaxID=2997339 RepID=A0AAU7AWG6_9ACTN
MTDHDLACLKRAYPDLPGAEPPAATVARLQAAYAEEDSATPSRATGGQRQGGRRPSRRTGLLAIGLVVISGTAVAASTGGWDPQLGTPGRGDRPRAAATPVPAEQLAALAVLRRPQTDRDRGPLVRIALRSLDRSLANGVHVEAIRVIDQGRRSATILIPAERTGPYEPRYANLAARDVLCLHTVAFVAPTTVTAGGRRRRVGGGYGGGGTCGTTSTLRTTGIRAGAGDNAGRVMTGPVDYEHGPLTHYATLVPDGVAKVTINLRRGRTVTVPVRDNVYRFAVPGIQSQLGTIWYDAAGTRIDHRARP